MSKELLCYTKKYFNINLNYIAVDIKHMLQFFGVRLFKKQNEKFTKDNSLIFFRFNR